MKVLLIDDHPLILAALENVILGLGKDVNVVTAASAREAREILARSHAFDLVLLDLHLGDANGFDVLSEFREGYPSLPVVVISASDRSSDVIRAIDMGAMGFVPKRSTNETLFEALHMVMSGGIYVPAMSLGVSDQSQRRRGAPGSERELPHPGGSGRESNLHLDQASGLLAEAPHGRVSPWGRGGR